MSLSLKTLIKDWIPPVMWRRLSEIYNKGKGIRFEGPYLSWFDVAIKSTGYGVDQILEKVLHATLKVKRGEAVFERFCSV